jgi:hypothetical protein
MRLVSVFRIIMIWVWGDANKKGALASAYELTTISIKKKRGRGFPPDPHPTDSLPQPVVRTPVILPQYSTTISNETNFFFKF